VIDAVDVALMAALQADATLAQLAPGGVHRDFEPESTPGRCVILTLQNELPIFEQGGTAHLQTRYQVKVVDQATTKTAAQAAIDRVDAILNGQVLAITGQTHMLTERVDRFAYLERVGSSVWQHVGCDYSVWSDPS
jgi:hypothetical protein